MIPLACSDVPKLSSSSCVLPEVFFSLWLLLPPCNRTPPCPPMMSYCLMIAREVVNSDCFVHKYTSAETSLFLLHCRFFGLWTTGLGISSVKTRVLSSIIVLVLLKICMAQLQYSYWFWYNLYFCSMSFLNGRCSESF